MSYDTFLPNYNLRKERDSNPRNSCPFTAFRVRPDRPLRHLSSDKGNCFYVKVFSQQQIFTAQYCE